ncbi:translocation/assembly module TamB domain-containing protein [Aquimarina sp. SS2-1]|uniref:translocation/assembly module TamB domain-containing protein n=1 Tax=Aquimarina besae TaxID=3342247 RepID=UPI00366ECDE0
MNNNKKKKYKWIKGLSKIVTGLLLIFILLVLFIRSQWGQNIIVNRLVSYASEKTGTTITVDKAYVTFSGNILVKGLYIEDQKQDTLLYSKKLEASLALIPLIRGKSYHLKSLEWSGVNTNIIKTEKTNSYNFAFIIDAFNSDTAPIEPQETASSVPIKIGDLSLSDFDINFLDETLGVDSKIKLGSLELDVDTFNLDSMNFEIDELNFKDSDIEFKQTKTIPTDTTSGNSILPLIKTTELNISEVKIHYESIPNKINFSSDVEKLKIEKGIVDLKQQKYSTELLTLSDSKISFTDLSERAESIPEKDQDFNWPDLNVQADKISLQNNSFLYRNTLSPVNPKEFNSKYIDLQSLNFVANDLQLAKGKADIQLQKVSFIDRSGFNLQHLSSKIKINESSKLSIENIAISTNTSNLKGSVLVSYNSLAEFIKSPERSTFKIGLDTVNLGISDAYYFQSDLAQNAYIDSLAQKTIGGSFFANGKISNLKTEVPRLSWGTQTTLEVNGRLKNLLTGNEITLDSLYYRVNSTNQDIRTFINEKDLGISIPKKLIVEGQISGSVQKLKGTTNIRTSMGSVAVKGNYYNKDKISFDGNVNIKQLQLQNLLNNEQLGPLTVAANISGSGTSINTLNATLDSDFKQLTLNEYDFSDLQLDGKLTNGKGKVKANFKDNNLNFLLDTNVVLDSISPQFDGVVDLKGADLNGLGVTQDIIKTQFKLFFDFEGNAKNFKLDSKIEDALVVKANEPYPVSDIQINALSNKNQSKISIDSRFLNANLSANTGLEQISSSLKNQLKTYISTSRIKDTISKSVKIDMDLVLREKPVVSDILLPGIKELDSITARIKFIEDKEVFNVSLNAPSLNYNGTSLDGLSLNIDGDQKDLNFSMRWTNILSDPIHINKTSFEGVLKDQTLLLDFRTNNETDEIAYLRSELRLKNDTLYYHIDPSSIVFDKNPWSIASNNQITIAKNHLEFRDFQLSQNQQEISITSNDPSIDKKHVSISFDRFYLSTFTSILSNDEILANGIVNGKLIIENPFDETGLVADLEIGNLEVTEIPLGDLNLNATSKSFQNYDLTLSLNGENAKLSLEGDYKAREKAADINFDFKLERLNVKVIEKFIDDQISDTKGLITGNAKITGTTLNPLYNGIFHFENTSMIVNTLNTRFTLPEENIKIDNSGLFLNNFTIADSNQNTFSLDGKIETKKLTNPNFDLTLNTKNFQILNATREDNDLFFGKVKITADLKIQGDLNVPKIRGNLAIDEGSNFTLIVPESQLEIKEREGVVVFVNRENPDAIITRVEEDQYSTALLKGYDVNTKLKIDKGSVFKIIIDERSKDNFQISGKGEFKFGMEPNGRTTLSGRYDINDGHYEVSLYNLVKRKFTIAPGGSITWLGDPLDAKLDVTAIYNVETSAASLMAAKTSGESAGVVNRFRQKLPFLVYLNVDGELLEPEISFQLDMPEDEQGALGGEVYGQVQQLNNQEEALNKQVFSLLVLNRFFPESGSDGSNGGAVSIARDNVNKVLSGQLNNFSEKLIGDTGIELDFGLNSYTDYQGNAPQNRTQLEINAQKRLFDDRLIVQVGSDVDIEGSSQNTGESTPVIGNVSLEYLLTKNGRYRLKGFRKNEFESVIDGQLVVTGIAFIFNREFNKFKELFSKSVRELEEQKRNKKEN